MWVRFKCPACQQTHQLDMPETTVHMTCGRSRIPIVMKLGLGGDVKAKLLSDAQGNNDSDSEESGEN